MTEPKGIDPAAWARFNQEVGRTPLEGRDHPIPQFMVSRELELELAPYAVELVELPPACMDLTLAVRRAASELEGTSEKGDRVALQLLTALAHFAKDIGT